jgi:hypothetical protein
VFILQQFFTLTLEDDAAVFQHVGSVSNFEGTLDILLYQEEEAQFWFKQRQLDVVIHPKTAETFQMVAF